MSDRPTNVARRHDWPERLDAYLAQTSAQAFAWGVNDCALFACAAIEAMTGVDPAAELRGRYNTRAGALRVLRTEGGGLDVVAGNLAAQHGFEEIKPALAQRGDLVLLDTEDGPALAIVGHDGMNAVCAGPQGMTRVPVLSCRRAWAVGRAA